MGKKKLKVHKRDRRASGDSVCGLYIGHRDPNRLTDVTAKVTCRSCLRELAWRDRS